MPDVDNLQQDRRYSLLLVIIGAGAILYGALAFLTESSPSPLLLFDPVLGGALLAAGLLWGPFFARRTPTAEQVPETVPTSSPAPSAPIAPPPGAQIEPPPIWLEDFEPALAETEAESASPSTDGVLLELDQIFEDAGRRRPNGRPAEGPESSG